MSSDRYMFVNVSYYDEQGSETNKEALTGHGFNMVGEYDEEKRTIGFWGTHHHDNNICPLLLEPGYSMVFDYNIPYHMTSGGQQRSSLVFTCVLDEKMLRVPRKNEGRFTVEKGASFI